MIECHKCGFYDSEFEACTCSSLDKWKNIMSVVCRKRGKE